MAGRRQREGGREVAYMAAKGVGMKPAEEEVNTRHPGFWLESSRPYR